jgi:hypothetical protein
LARAIVAIVVVILDFHWIGEAMRAPGWDGVPDMDGVFSLGLIVRVCLIWMVLRYVGNIGTRMKASSNRRALEA